MSISAHMLATAAAALLLPLLLVYVRLRVQGPLPCRLCPCSLYTRNNNNNSGAMATGGRDASAANVRRRANRAGPAAGWTWRDARRTLRLGVQEGVTSVVLHRNGDARFNFPTAQMSACSTERVAAGQQRGAQRQPQKQRANRTVPTQKPTDAPMGESESLLNKKQQKSADRLQKYNLEMAAILGLKLRLFMLRVLKRARHERVWSVARPFLKAQATNPASPAPLICTGVSRADGDRGQSGTKRTSRSSPNKVGSPSSSLTPSKSRPRTDASTAIIPAGDGPGLGTSPWILDIIHGTQMCTD